MRFDSPTLVDEVIQKAKDDSWTGDQNMAKINSLFNGDPVWTKAEAKRQKVQINLPSSRAPTILDNARGQWEVAFTSRDKFFRCQLRDGPPEQRPSFSFKFTRNLAEIMRRSPEFLSFVSETGAQVMMHGRGPMSWENADVWSPYAIGLGDLKIPPRTLTSFTNMGWFGIYKRFTPFDLYDKALGAHADKRWKKSVVKRLLAKLKDVNVQSIDFSTWEFPIEIAEDIKSNSGYYSSSAQPTIFAWDFFHRMDEKKGWRRCMILDRKNPAVGIEDVPQREWLYEDNDVYEPELSHILQCIFANGCHVAPFRYHSVRGLGYRLYDEARYEARAENRFKESVLQEMMWVFRNVPAESREKLESFWLSHMGVLPPGVSYVPANERYRMDLNIVLAGLNQSRQLMSEQSTSYVQDFNEGGENNRETATKTMARVQQSNQMVGTFLVKSYEQWKYTGKEIVRRFLRKESTNDDVKEFREKCLEDGIPEEFMYPECWAVEPERVSGNGNRILAQTMADRLMMQYNRFDPAGQRIVQRIYVDANVDDPDLGDAIVPMKDEDQDTPTVAKAYRDIGPLMLGLDAPQERSEIQIEYVETLLKALEKLVAQAAQQSNGMPDMKTIQGLSTIDGEIRKRIQLISQDEGERQRVKVYMDILGKMENQIKAFVQRLQEAQKRRGPQMDPAMMAKIQANNLMTQSKLKSKELSDAQRRKHKEIGFWADQRRKDAETAVNARRQLQDAHLQAAVTDVKTEAEIRNLSRKSLAMFNGEGGEE